MHLRMYSDESLEIKIIESSSPLRSRPCAAADQHRAWIARQDPGQPLSFIPLSLLLGYQCASYSLIAVWRPFASCFQSVKPLSFSSPTLARSVLPMNVPIDSLRLLCITVNCIINCGSPFALLQKLLPRLNSGTTFPHNTVFWSSSTSCTCLLNSGMLPRT